MTIARSFLGILLLIHVLPIITIYNRRGPHLLRHQHRDDNYLVRRFEAFRASLVTSQKESDLSSPPPPVGGFKTREYHVTSYGADPTGATDSTQALLNAFADASKPISNHTLIAGIINVGGAQIHLDGGIYLISHPLRFPKTGVGNILSSQPCLQKDVEELIRVSFDGSITKSRAKKIQEGTRALLVRLAAVIHETGKEKWITMVQHQNEDLAINGGSMDE